MVCLRNISVDTVHKGDTDDDENNNVIPLRSSLGFGLSHCHSLKGQSWLIGNYNAVSE